MKSFFFKKAMAVLVSVIMIVALIPASAVVAMADDLPNNDPVYILAGSDFQPSDSVDAGKTLMGNILDEVKNAGYTSFDGFLFAGDYNYAMDGAGSETGKQAVHDTVTNYFGEIDHEVYAQGNHDQDYVVESALSPSGKNDPESGDYGVFVINEMDYMWGNDNAAVIQNTGDALSRYLEDKYVEGFDRPIFVISHIPLHYNLRTQVGGFDGIYAKYIFDALQEAGEKGLNVFFMYGHNHSHGWDDYIGGAAVYLQEGDSINIAKLGSATEYTTETLAFTYLNAGFVSYYRAVNPGACTDLTMTVFKIQGDEVQIERFNADGKTNLKAAGVLNTSHHVGGSGGCCELLGTETYVADTRVVNTGTVALTTLAAPATVTSGAVSIRAPGLTEMTVTEGTPSTTGRIYTATYDMAVKTAAGNYSAPGLVTVRLPDAFKLATKYKLSATVDGEACRVVSWKDGVLTLMAPRTGHLTVNYTTTASTAKVYYELVTTMGELESGGTYLIACQDPNKYVRLAVTADESNVRHGFGLINTEFDNMPVAAVEGKKAVSLEWIFTEVDGKWYIGKKTQRAEFYNDNSRVGLQFGDDGTAFTLTPEEETFTISGALNNVTYYWQYNATGDLVNGYSTTPTSFYIYKKMSGQVTTAPETTVVDETTAEPTTTVEPITTAEPGTTAEPTTTDAQTTAAPAKKGGCGSGIGTGVVLVVLSVTAGACALRKKREE